VSLTTAALHPISSAPGTLICFIRNLPGLLSPDSPPHTAMCPPLFPTYRNAALLTKASSNLFSSTKPSLSALTWDPLLLQQVLLMQYPVIQCMDKYVFFFFLKDFIYLFERERMREST